MKRSPPNYVRDILDAMEKVQTFTGGMEYAGFLRDDKTNFAVARALEIVGEATKNVPERNPRPFPRRSLARNGRNGETYYPMPTLGRISRWSGKP